MSTIAEPHVCEIMLGHKLPGVWQVYDKHLYLDEQKKKAYTEWWHRLKRINSNESNVVTIDDKRAI
ncbi:hypothetical protein [Vibrio harveyi]|uniref:hypothetical protein n=1 Tax=Vibrio harveyi TaxID=669 RepID=UPI00217CD160|nr:hypothetical protein [Vibrio harveyi]